MGADNGFGSRGRGDRLFGGLRDSSTAGDGALFDRSAGDLATGGKAAGLGIIHWGRATGKNPRAGFAGVSVCNGTGLVGGAGGKEKEKKNLKGET